MTVGGFYFSRPQPIGRFLWAAPSNLELFYRPMSATLNPQVYATVRNLIVTKLGPRTQSDISSIPNG
jgi:hypothetical protein